MRQELEPELRHVEANGLRFAYLEAGEGPLALLVHGFPDTPHTWRELTPALCRAGYRVVAPFTRGYAPTQTPATSKTSMEDLGTDALALIEALGYESAVVVGHDWGAGAAYMAASLRPERVEKLVVVGIPHPASIRPSAGLLWSARHFIGLRLPGARWRMRRNGFALVDALCRRWSPTWDFGRAETAEVRKCFGDPASLNAALGYYRGAQLGSVPSALRERIEVPTLAVAGADDPGIDVSAYETARSKFAGDYRVLALPGGHFVHRESPGGFAEGVVSFLSEA